MSWNNAFWELEIIITWPHDRCAVGWEYIGPVKDEPISTFRIFFFILTLALHVHEQ